MLLQDAAGKKGYNGKCDNHGCQYGADNRHRQATDKITGSLGQKYQGKERDDQGCSASQHCLTDLLCGFQCGFKSCMSFPKPPFDVLNHNDAVVNQQTQCHHQTHYTQLIKIVSQKI